MRKLYNFQRDILYKVKNHSRCALYCGLGTGKTLMSLTKAKRMCIDHALPLYVLIVCQKSKVSDWCEEAKEVFADTNMSVRCLHSTASINEYIKNGHIGVITYDLIWRRKNLDNIMEHDYVMIMDESSLIQHETAKRTKSCMKYAKSAYGVILCSGTPISGKYEHLWTQLVILGWDIRKRAFWNRYVDYEIDKSQGFPLMIVHGYKREENLHKKMAEYGCVFLKTEDAVDLPEAQNINIKVPVIDEYNYFRRYHLVTLSDGTEIVGDNILTQLLGERQLCGICNQHKLDAFKDLIESTSERVIVFYNFTAELEKMKDCIEDRPVSIVNGETKDLSAYNEYDNSITFIQYQAGAMGLNLQKAHITVYFTPPLSSELYEQSLGRTRRIGQNNHCLYYHLICENSVEEKIYRTLAMRMDYTERLFEKDIS